MKQIVHSETGKLLPSRLFLLFVLSSLLAGCTEKRTRAPEPDEMVRAAVTVDFVDVRKAPYFTAPVLMKLRRGSEVSIREMSAGFARVALPQKGEGFIPANGIERVRDRGLRLERTKKVVGFTPQRGRVLSRTPVLLAPDYGASEWVELPPGSIVDVLIFDPDFFGVRIPGLSMGFIPVRSLQLVAPQPILDVPAEGTQPLDEKERSAETPEKPEVVVPMPEPEAPPEEEGPLESLPAGALAPALLKKVEPDYPEAARRARISGEVVLRVLIEADGRVSSAEVVKGLGMGLDDSAVRAVMQWMYAPARVNGRPVAVYSTARARFLLR